MIFPVVGGTESCVARLKDELPWGSESRAEVKVRLRCIHSVKAILKRSVRTVDDRGPNETTALQLSSPSSREDRETGEIVLNLTRWSEFSKDADHDWTAHAYLYRIPVV